MALFALVFGLLLVGLGVRALLVERRVAKRRRRPIRPDLVASTTLAIVFGTLSLLLAAAVAFVFPR